MKSVELLGVKVKPEDVERIVHDQLASGGTWGSRDDMDNAAGLSRAIRALDRSPLRGPFITAAVDAVTDPDPNVRMGALLVARSYGQDIGAGPRLLAAWRGHPELFRNIPISVRERDLESLLLSAMAASVKPEDNEVLDALRELVRGESTRDLVLAGLARADPRWMAHHVFDWLGDDGGRLGAILVNVPEEAEVEEVVRAISKASPQIRAGAADVIRQSIPDRDRAAHLMSLLDT